MRDPAQLEKRIEELERAVGEMRGRRYGVRYRSRAALGDFPLLAVAVGPDLSRGEIRGHAKGVIALGDFATGIVAVGGLARGLVAIGGLTAGLFSFGGLTLGLLLAFGGLSFGSVAVGGMAVGGVAIGGGAAGYYACGGGATGTHVVSATRRDPQAVAFFREFALGSLCRPR